MPNPMFFFRRDRSLKKAISRRLKSSRGSAYLEFSIVLPIVVMVVSAMIEFTSYWDAKIMANHAAWTCGRIATVRAGQGEKKLLKGKPQNVKDLLNPKEQIDGMYVATAALMSTCSMGSMHGSSANLAEDWFNGFIGDVKKQIKSSIKSAVNKQEQSAFSSVTKAVSGELGSSVAGVLESVMKEVSGKIIDSILNPMIDKMVDGIADKIFPEGAFDEIGDYLDKHRLARQIVYAADRVAKHNVVQVLQAPSAGQTSWRTIPADYPATVDTKSQKDDWMVKSNSGWPPNGVNQHMIVVKIAWPFERAWMFPVLSSAMSAAKSMEHIPTAEGYALFYPQPAIKSANLSATNPEAYAMPAELTQAQKDYKSLKDQFVGFLKIALLSYDYRFCQELVGPYDSGASYKGIGRGVEGVASAEDLSAEDGLVFWMGRAPENTKSQAEWKAKTPPDDYYRCFKALTEQDSETCDFHSAVKVKDVWYQITHWKKRRKQVDTQVLSRLQNKAYHDKQWFFWGTKETPHLRYDHGTAEKFKEETADSSCFFSWCFLHEGYESQLCALYPDIAKMSPETREALLNAWSATKAMKYPGFGGLSDSWSLKESEYNGLVGNLGVSYTNWLAFTRANAPLFDLNARALFRMQTSRAEDLITRETDVFMKQIPALIKKNADLTKMVESCRAELAVQIEKGAKGAGYDYGDMASDYSTDPAPSDVVQSDKEMIAADSEEMSKEDLDVSVEKMRERLKALEAKIIPDVDKIDEAEQKARTAYAALKEWIGRARSDRRAWLAEWVAKTAAALQIADPPSPDMVVKIQKEKFPMLRRDWGCHTRALEEACKAYGEALDALREAENKFAADLGLKSQNKPTVAKTEAWKTKLTFGPNAAAEADLTKDGTDDDQLGDFWKLEKSGGGWKKHENAEEDL